MTVKQSNEHMAAKLNYFNTAPDELREKLSRDATFWSSAQGPSSPTFSSDVVLPRVS